MSSKSLQIAESGTRAVRFLRRAIAEARILPFVYCYPPRTSYVANEAPTDLRAVWVRDAATGTDLNVYIHIPFCRYRCAFCGLYNITTRDGDGDLHRAYVASVIAELKYLAPSLIGRCVRTVFIGGGTPFAIGIPLLVELLAGLATVFPNLSSTVEEVTVEASPDSVMAVRDQLGDLVAAGVNRVSMGVQSYDIEELRRAGRAAAGPELVVQSLQALRDAGVANIGADLIIGLEGQTDATMTESLDRLLSFLPETVSLYLINPRLGTGLGRRMERFPRGNHALYRRLSAASAALHAAGYERETSVQFKLPGRGGLLHKRLYFDGVSVLGLGSGARSYTADEAYLRGGGQQRSRGELETYLQSASGTPTARTGVCLSPEEAERRMIILGLQDLAIDLVPSGMSGSFAEPYASVFAACLELGLMVRHERALRLTERGFVYRDIICWSLFSDQALVRHADHGIEFGSGQRCVSAA